MRGKGRGVVGILAGALIGLLLTADASALEVGQKAPDFTLAGPDGKPVKLADLLGKGPVVVFTFIQAFTRG
jgi:peroxiredoxin Q/BCP